jgi:phosphohistidine phosphatase SixA
MDRLEVGLKLAAIRTRKLAEAGKDDDYILTDPMIRVIETIEAIRAEKRKKV